MDNEIYLIHLDDYLDHIDGKLEMYELLLELVRSLRHDLEAVEDAQALRTLCAYEQKAHEVYENWGIPDSYTESGDPDDLAQLMEDEQGSELCFRQRRKQSGADFATMMRRYGKMHRCPKTGKS